MHSTLLLDCIIMEALGGYVNIAPFIKTVISPLITYKLSLIKHFKLSMVDPPKVSMFCVEIFV